MRHKMVAKFALKIFIALTVVAQMHHITTVAWTTPEAETTIVTEIVTIEETTRAENTTVAVTTTVPESTTTESTTTVPDTTTAPNTTAVDTSTVNETTTLADTTPAAKTTIVTEIMSEENTTEPENTTIAETTTKQTTTVVTTEGETTTLTIPATTTPEPSFPPPIPPVFEDVDAVVEMKADMVVDEVYNEDLDDPTSDLYRNMTSLIERTITEAMRGTFGFERVEVHGFRNGSIIVNMTMYFTEALKSNPEEADFCSTFLNITNGISINQTTNQTYETDFRFGQDCTTVLEDVRANICADNSLAVCDPLRNCRITARNLLECVHPCYELLYENRQCMTVDGFQCTVDMRANRYASVCSCLGDYFYVNEEYCLHHDVVIIISSVCGGVLLIVFIVVTTVLLGRLKPARPVQQLIPLSYNQAEDEAKPVNDMEFSAGQAAEPEPKNWYIKPYEPPNDMEEKAAVRANTLPEDVHEQDKGRINSTNDNTYDHRRTDSGYTDDAAKPNRARQPRRPEDRARQPSRPEDRARQPNRLDDPSYGPAPGAKTEEPPSQRQSSKLTGVLDRQSMQPLNRDSLPSARSAGSYLEESNPAYHAVSWKGQPREDLYTEVDHNRKWRDTFPRTRRDNRDSQNSLLRQTLDEDLLGI